MNITEGISSEILQAKQRFGIIGNAPALTNAIGRALQVAPIDLSVLVIGESGTGKEFFPKIIHAYSPRKHNKYIAVNCGAIPEGTIDSELFGHEKGAFTGAVSSRKGYFEEADGGTIFLDEVAELPLTTQARLLRVLESGEFIKVGSSQVQKTNIRVVAATNVDMNEAVRKGKFREDLYYRLSTVQISVPPLNSRGNDIMLLARKFANDFSERYRMPVIKFGDEARNLMLHYRWPGNVRQLKNVVEQLSLFHAGEEIARNDIEQYMPDNSGEYSPAVNMASHSYEHERELLFNMLFRMQREIDSLREQLDESEQARPVHHDTHYEEMPHSLVHYQAPTNFFEVKGENGTDGNVEPITLEQTERDTIKRVLDKNGGRRKATAAELNISERTLYRKIKEFGLE